MCLSPQTTDNIDFKTHSSPAVFFICEVKSGVVSLAGINNEKNIELSFSVFSYSRNYGLGSGVDKFSFLNYFDNVFYVSNSKKTPGFLDGVPLVAFQVLLNLGFGRKTKNFGFVRK